MNARQVTGATSVALGIGIVASAVLGPLVLRVVTFRTSERIETQFIGGEVVSLAVVAPVAIVAGVLWWRGHCLAPALTLGPSLYAVYTYTTVVVGQEYSRYPGNVERAFPLYAGLVACGAILAARSWSALGGITLPVLATRRWRLLAGTMLSIGGFFALAWSAQIRLVLTGNPSAEYLEGPALFWVIKLLDVGFVIPALLATGVGLLREQPRAIRAAYGLSAFATCLAGSIAGMAIAMEVTNDPSAQPAMLVVALAATTGLTLLTARLMRPLVGSDSHGRHRSTSMHRPAMLAPK